MTSRWTSGLGFRIAVAAIAVALLAVGIVAVGTLVLGSHAFLDLMTADGHPASESQAMFDESVGRVVVMGLGVAVLAAIGLAVLLAGRIAKPLSRVGLAAKRIADGDYRARVPREGTREVADLAETFNDMAAALEEQERLRREFVANAAHELKTPLTNLQGYLEALRDEVIPADRETFQSLWEEAERLVRLARSLDTLPDPATSGIRAELTGVDIAAVARAVSDLAAPGFAAAGLEFQLEVEPSLPVLADPDGLKQVIGNLLQNALRYTLPPGVVRLQGQQHDGVVRVEVSNSGPGIPAADLPHVFERFYRVEKSRDTARGGAGIGLAIVRELVTSFGGGVGIESADGRTKVWFELPAVASRGVARAQRTEARSASR
jgi:two-component system, OmpR family, sensor histidine kinase BaeS